MFHNKIVFLVPSRTLSKTRLNLAQKSLKSLSEKMGESLQAIVVHDGIKKPGWIPEKLFQMLPSAYNDLQGAHLYQSKRSTVVKRSGRGSASALLLAVERAIEKGFDLGYIHLDDHIYNKHLPILMGHAEGEFAQSPDLAWLRFSGYPIISPGGRDYKRVEKEVHFDDVVLQPRHRNNYTCWSTVIDERAAGGSYWPVAMWHSLYKLDVLKAILKEAIKSENCLHLANVEEHFKSGTGMRWLMDNFGEMSFGYINMQFAGFEMHRNPNYRLLLAGPNQPEL
jgi:hypothetical protein